MRLLRMPRKRRGQAQLTTAAVVIAAVFSVVSPAAAAPADDPPGGIPCELTAHGEVGPIFGTPDVPQPDIISFSGSVACAEPVASITGRVDLLTPAGALEATGPEFAASGVPAAESETGYFEPIPGAVHVVRTAARITALKGDGEFAPLGDCVALTTTTVKCVTTFTFTVPASQL